MATEEENSTRVHTDWWVTLVLKSIRPGRKITKLKADRLLYEAVYPWLDEQGLDMSGGGAQPIFTKQSTEWAYDFVVLNYGKPKLLNIEIVEALMRDAVVPWVRKKEWSAQWDIRPVEEMRFEWEKDIAK